MLYILEGQLSYCGDSFILVEIGVSSGGLGFKVFTNERTFQNLPKLKERIKLFCFLYLREERFELYGFLEEQALKLFEMLNSVTGIGPKTALGVLDIDTVPNIMAAIIEKRADFLTRSSGIGRKTAERVILELQNKIKLPESKALTEKMTIDAEIEEALVGLGYNRSEVRKSLSAVKSETNNLEERLREVLRALSRLR